MAGGEGTLAGRTWEEAGIGTTPKEGTAAESASVGAGSIAQPWGIGGGGWHSCGSPCAVCEVDPQCPPAAHWPDWSLLAEIT